MAKPEWGTKRQCPKCGERFYDLNKPLPLTCVACGTQFEPEVVLKSKQPAPEAKPVRKAPAAKPEPEADADEERDEDVELDEEEEDDDVLNDVDELDDDDMSDVIEKPRKPSGEA